MSIFDDEQIEEMFTRIYICSKCGARMVFENEWEDTLVCNECGHDVSLDNYGSEDENEYVALYPIEEHGYADEYCCPMCGDNEWTDNLMCTGCGYMID